MRRPFASTLELRVCVVFASSVAECCVAGSILKGAGGEALLERKEEDPEGLCEREPRWTGEAGVGGEEEGREAGGWYDLARETTWKPAVGLLSECDDGAVEGGEGEFVREVQVVDGGECGSEVGPSTAASESEHEERISPPPRLVVRPSRASSLESAR